MPPRHDLRGGNASDDSFAMSSSILTTSTNRCFLAVGRQKDQKCGSSNLVSHKNLVPLASHHLMEVVSGWCQTWRWSPYMRQESERAKGGLWSGSRHLRYETIAHRRIVVAVSAPASKYVLELFWLRDPQPPNEPPSSSAALCSAAFDPDSTPTRGKRTGIAVKQSGRRKSQTLVGSVKTDPHRPRALRTVRVV